MLMNLYCAKLDPSGKHHDSFGECIDLTFELVAGQQVQMGSESYTMTVDCRGLLFASHPHEMRFISGCGIRNPSNS